VLTWAIESPLVFLTDSVTDTQGLVLVILASNVPSVVAIVLTASVFGRGPLRKLLARLLIWRVDPRWYLVVVLGPAALAGGVVGLNTFLGGPALSLGMPLLTAVILLAFMIFPGSALGEEIGWRGYALPCLQAGRSALSASLHTTHFTATTVSVRAFVYGVQNSQKFDTTCTQIVPTLTLVTVK
jgi:membrane protease YdiL (CAAX protease family)